MRIEVAKKTDGFSGRQLAKLVLAYQAWGDSADVCFCSEQAVPKSSQNRTHHYRLQSLALAQQGGYSVQLNQLLPIAGQRPKMFKGRMKCNELIAVEW